jgi:hypothetical protein
MWCLYEKSSLCDLLIQNEIKEKIVNLNKSKNNLRRDNP